MSLAAISDCCCCCSSCLCSLAFVEARIDPDKFPGRMNVVGREREREREREKEGGTSSTVGNQASPVPAVPHLSSAGHEVCCLDSSSKDDNESRCFAASAQHEHRECGHPDRQADNTNNDGGASRGGCPVTPRFSHLEDEAYIERDNCGRNHDDVRASYLLLTAHQHPSQGEPVQLKRT
ncbi:uncharacterized protein LOC135111741 isoform X3 [Scylla paramamosain]|uniref:uncharacterized protein LOC135111741 isoform X3 n=1 Tax=Scylla paramamosain TaxID=85552 RepID=UPI003082DE7F